MHDAVELAVVGDTFLVTFALHEVEGEGTDGAGDKGDSVEHSAIC